MPGIARIGFTLLIGGLLMHLCMFMNANYYVNANNNGTSFECSDLIDDFSSGNTSEFSKIYGSSIIKNGSRTVSEFEIDYDYEFKSCRDSIEYQKEVWCKIKISEIFPNNFNSKIEELEKYCNFTKADFVSNYKNPSFEIKEGQNTLLRYEGRWLPIRDMVIWDPYASHNPENGLFKLCIVDDFARCLEFKSMKDAEKEHERLLKYLVKG